MFTIRGYPMRRFSTLVSLVTVCILTMTGCHPYVNIPPQAGDIASHRVDTESVRQVSVLAIKAVYQDRPTVGPYTLVLAEGSSWATYQTALKTLGEFATLDSGPKVPILEVRELRIRADKAEVDVVRPADDFDPHRLGRQITVYLNWDPFAGWMVTRLHHWQSTVPVVEPPEIKTPEMTPPQATPAPGDKAQDVEQSPS